MKSPIVLLSSLFTDVKRLEPGVKGLDRDLITIEFRHKHEGDSFLTIALPALCDSVTTGLATGKFTCPSGFKRVRGGAIPRFLSGMLCEVFDAITGDLKESSHEHMVKAIRECLLLFKKLRLDDDQVETLDREAKTKFFKHEDVCRSSINFDERELFILKSVSRYILPNIESFDVRSLRCKHGPGAVAESFKTNQKWLALSSVSHLIEDYGFDCFAFQSSRVPQKAFYSSLRDSAKLISVPKNSTSRRTITVEPMLKQFVQQGYNNLIREEIPKCGILRQCLALTDQTKNQYLALEGSRTGKWATIDLSSASDLLSVKMVSLVFEGKPNLLEGLLNCRSTRISDGISIRDIEKFAGMGNATTFPVQSIVFAVLAISALLHGLPPTYRNVKRVSRSVRVFGDDIIVPADRSHHVVDWLTKAGLAVNIGKSFLTGNFKESCGVDAYRGVDVTPLYVRHHPVNISKKEPSTIAHYVELSNHFWLRGLYAVSATLVKIVEEALGRRLPLVTSKSGVLGLHSRQEAFEVHRWNSELQRPELKGPMLLPVFREDVIDGYAALLKFFVSSDSSDGTIGPCLFPEGKTSDTKHLERSPVRFKNRIVQRWVAS